MAVRSRAMLFGAVVAVLGGCETDAPIGTDNQRIQCTLFSNNVVDGGVGRDGIPALSDPELLEADAAAFLEADDRVLGIVQNGVARAYPFAILWWHEIVNDTLGGEPVVATYCPLTGSGLAFDPRANGRVHDFGVSGLLFENNLMMFDRESESLWPQLSLGARCGEASGTELRRVPLVETTWGAWRQAYPATTVVSDSTGFQRPYGQYPYGAYDTPDNPFLLAPSSPFSQARPPKELVLALQLNGAAVAYPLPVLDSAGAVHAVNDTVGGEPLVVLYDRASNTAVALHATLESDTLTFATSPDVPGQIVDRETRSVWTTWGVAVDGPLAGRELDRVVDAYTMFWFAWSVFHPDTELLQ